MAIPRAIVIGLAVLLALNACEACKPKAPKKPKITLIKAEDTGAQAKWKPPTSTPNSGCFNYAEFQWVSGDNAKPNSENWGFAEGDELRISGQPAGKLTLFLRSAGSDASERTVYSGTVKKSVTIKGGENPN